MRLRETTVIPSTFGIILMLLAMGCSPVHVLAGIDTVKVSPDGHRVAVEFEGEMGRPVVHPERSRSRLIVDFQGVSADSLPVPLVREQGPLREIRFKRSGQGVRMVMDFRGYSLPEHAVRRVGNCYLVFLGDSKVLKKRSVRTAKRSRRKARRRPSTSSDRSWAAAPAASGARLEVSSAKVVDGMIVLEVLDLNRPGYAYRIKLGVDLEQAGFTAANIRRVRQRVSTGRNSNQTSTPTAHASASGPGVRAAPVPDLRLCAGKGPTRSVEPNISVTGSMEPWPAPTAPEVTSCSYEPGQGR